MAVPFLSVNLRSPACDFEPLMLAPDLPVLDPPAGQASCRTLRKWLGGVVAEPCWTSTGVVYFLPGDDSTISAGAHPQCITPQDLRSGPIRDQYLKLWTSLSHVQPEPAEAPLLAAVCKSFETPDGVDRMSRLGDCLFKYRDAHKQWRLAWAWGYRRKADRAGRTGLCPRCSVLSVQPEGSAFHCPACGWRSLPRLLTAAALAALLMGLGWGLWAATRPSAAQAKLVAQQIEPAASPAPRTLLVERPADAVPTMREPGSAHARAADMTIAKITKPARPEAKVARAEPVRTAPLHTAMLVKPIATPPPAPAKVEPVAVARAATQSRTITAQPRPAAIVAHPTSAPLPSGVRVDPDGKVYLGYRSVAPTFEETTHFSPTGKQPSRYIYGSHVSAVSHDELRGGQPALQQWQHYVMSDELSDRPADANGDHSVSLVLLDRGTDAEITNAASPGVDSWSDTGSPVHLVQTSGSKTAGQCNTNHGGLREPAEPRFDLSVDNPAPFYPTTPRCHSKHHHRGHGGGGYGPYIRAATDPALFRRFTPSSREATLDAKLTVVALQYFGHSSPDEVLADLQAARVTAQAQATAQNNSDAHHAILQLCDSEIALWQDVLSSNSTAGAAEAAFKNGDARRAGELCRDYQAQVAAYADRPEWSLFETQSQQVAALADKLNGR